MEPIVSDGRTRLRLWNTMTSRLPPEASIARLKAATAPAMALRSDQPIAHLTGKDWAVLWKRGERRRQPVRALFLKLDQHGMGSAITYAPIPSPPIGLVIAFMLVIVAFNADIWEPTFAAIMAGMVVLYLLIGFVFSRKEGEMLADFARQTLQAQDSRS